MKLEHVLMQYLQEQHLEEFDGTTEIKKYHYNKK